MTPLADVPLDPGLAPTMLRLIEAASGVRRRFQFFVWMQNHLQQLLPHPLAVCGLYQRSQRALAFDLFNSIVLPPASQGLLADARSPLLASALSRWVDGRGRALALPLQALAGDHDGSDALLALGVVDMLVHGVARPHRPGEVESLFVIAARAGDDSTRLTLLLELLMPYLHATYVRVQTVERELGVIAGVPAATPPRPGGRLVLLTERERQVLAWVRDGLSNQQIGLTLDISALTVKNHIQKILRKLDASNRAQAVAKAVAMGALAAESGSGASRPRLLGEPQA